MSYSARIATDQQALIAMLFDASVTGQPSPSLAESRFLDGVARSINQSLRDLVLQSLRGEEIRDYFKVAMFGFGSLFEASLQVESALFAEQASRSLASISDLGNYPLESVDEPSQNTIANYIRRIRAPRLSYATRDVYETIRQWADEQPASFPPIVVLITDGKRRDNRWFSRLEAIKRIRTADGHALLFVCQLRHFEESQRNGTVWFPNSASELPDQTARELYALASEIPESLIHSMQVRCDADHHNGPRVGSRGMVFQADPSDLPRFLSCAAPMLAIGTCSGLDRLSPASTRTEPVRPDAQLLQGDDSTNPEKPIAYDENVQFTVFRPKAVMPERWHSLLAFAHLDELPEGSNQPDPIEEVERQAAAILGPLQERYKQTVQDSSQAVPKEGELTFVPEITGCEFNPPRQVIRWVESVHKAEFRLRASLSQDGKMVRGRMSIFLGAILLAEIPLRISVDSRHQDQMDGGPNQATHVIPYRKIFASYSHQDRAIVNQFEKYATTLGDRYLRDVQDLRSGENWDERLLTMIEEADVFQLFWSRNSMASPYVQREWRHAISLVHKGPYFVRPTYWQQPLPEDPSNDLPPAELRKRHFTCLHPEMEITPAAKDYEQRFFSRASENASEKMDVEISPDWVNQGLKLLLGIHGCPAEQSHVALQLVDDCAFGSSSEVERIYREARKGVGLRLMQVTPRQLRSQRDWVYFQLETRGPEWDDVLKTRKLALRLPKRIVAFQQGSLHQQSLSVPAEHKMLELKIALFALMP